jgi:hypothetical protein
MEKTRQQKVQCGRDRVQVLCGLMLRWQHRDMGQTATQAEGAQSWPGYGAKGCLRLQNLCGVLEQPERKIANRL